MLNSTKDGTIEGLFFGVDGKVLVPVDLHSKCVRPLDPPDPIESASRVHFAGKQILDNHTCQVVYLPSLKLT